MNRCYEGDVRDRQPGMSGDDDDDFSVAQSPLFCTSIIHCSSVQLINLFYESVGYIAIKK